MAEDRTQNQLSNGNTDDTFERDLEEMLEDGPNVNEASSTVLGGTPNRMSSSYPGSSTTSNVPLSNNHSSSNTSDFVPKTMTHAAHSKFETIKEWSMNTYKCTRQFLSERLGKGSKTVDVEMEGQIEALRDTQRKYSRILLLARAMTNHFYHVVQTQRAMGDTFSELAQKSPELQEEFTTNCESQRALVKNGETLLGALNFFTSSINTLCNKTMEDTLQTVKHYEVARLEYDAYRSDMDYLSQAPKDSAMVQKLDDSKRKFEEHKLKFERLRGDVNIKLKFLEENKVKVMHKQLLLFHNAISAYFSGNEAALETTLKQFNISLKRPNAEKPSWIEQ